MKAWPQSWLVCCGVLVCISYASSTCVGNSCSEQHASAAAAGLLGSTALSAASCDNKTYPASGKLNPVMLDAPVVDIRWAGGKDDFDKYLFVLLRGADNYIGGHVWRNDQYGSGDWSDITQKLKDALPSDKQQAEDMLGVLDLHFHQRHPEKILFQGPGFYFWITTDFGQTFTAHLTPGDATLGFWMELKVHPNVPDWLLAKVKRKDCLQDLSSAACAHDLFVSQDFGSSWTNLTEKALGKVAAFWDFDWGASLTHTDPSKSFDDEVIFATIYEDASAMKGPYPGWDKDLHFVRSDDLWDSHHTKLVACGNQFEVVGQRVFLAMPSACPVAPDGSKRSVPTGADDRGAVTMYTSDDNAQTFKQACLPVKDLDLGYNLVRTHDGKGAFVIVDHDEIDPLASKAPMSTVYASGYDASMFTVSLPRNYRSQQIADFARVAGLPGIYMANQLDDAIFQDPATPHYYTDFKDHLQTKITFNGGSQWSELQKPATYKHSECNGCRDVPDAKCKLHLHGPTGWVDGPDSRPSFYSHGNAPGVIMAAGNTGEFLDASADNTCTWLSRDGGLNWEDVADYAAIYEFGDHGSIILTARYQTEEPADSVAFSFDGGSCWNTIQLATALDVQNIRVEPQGASHVFLVHGAECRKTASRQACTFDPSHTSHRKGIMYVIDIKTIMGSDWKVCNPQSDYETWTPPGNSQCLLGQKISMQRRKPSVSCFNDKAWARAGATYQACECEHEDFECDFGYERRSGSCQSMPGITSDDCGQISSGNYYVSESHLRLIHNDSCLDVDRVLTDSDGHGTCIGPNCPNTGKGRGALGKFFIFLLVVGLVTTVFVVWWLFAASDSMKAMAEELLSPVIGFFDSVIGWIRDKVSTLLGRQQSDAQEAYFQPLSGGEGLALDEEDARSPPLFPMR
ncbi:hypothetical protein ABBQ38_005375 [Trebouxia sp. C0009 RCD-2024]